LSLPGLHTKHRKRGESVVKLRNRIGVVFCNITGKKPSKKYRARGGKRSKGKQKREKVAVGYPQWKKEINQQQMKRCQCPRGYPATVRREVSQGSDRPVVTPTSKDGGGKKVMMGKRKSHRPIILPIPRGIRT